MKKVLIGVGIGCGVLILVVAGVLVAGGLWAKNKFGGSIEAAQKLQTQEKELVELNSGHPFKPPAEGEVLALDAKRLEAYFAVREETMPVFKAFEEKSQAFEKEHGDTGDGKQPGFSAAVDAANLMLGLVADVRAAYIAGLKKHGMSPVEFQTITGTVYASMVAEGVEQMRGALEQGREAMEKQLAELDKKLEDESLPDEQRTQLEEVRGQLQAQLDSMDDSQAEAQDGLSGEAKKVAAANMELLKQYEERAKVMANSAFDAFVQGGAGSQSSAQDMQ